MFHLKTDTSQLASANSNLGEFNYQQLPPVNSATGAQFSNAEIRFAWQTSGMRWIDLSRSFVRMRLRVENGGNAGLGFPILTSDDFALSMDTMACMFQSCEFRIAETTVSKIDSHVPQVSALKHRAQKSKAWLDSAGASCQMMQASFKKRQSVLAADGLVLDSGMGYSRDESHAGAGIDATTTVAYTAATGTFTYANPVGLNIVASAHLAVGDTIAGNVIGLEFTARVRALTATTIVVGANMDLGANVPAHVDNYEDFDIRNVERALPSRQVSKLELTWQPPLSVFDLPHALPAGRYELILTPKNGTDWMRAAVESVVTAKIPIVSSALAGSVRDNIFLEVENIYLDLAEVQGHRVDDQVYLLDLVDLKCNKKALSSAQTGQEEFSVAPSTIALSLAFQDTRAGSSTLYPQSKLTVGDGLELKLRRFYLDYAQQKRPRVDANPLYKEDPNYPEDYTLARYVDTMVQTAGYFRSGGCEPIEEWHERGAYYHFAWPKEGVDRSTSCLVSYEFSQALANTAVLLYSHFRKTAMVRVEDGRVVEVRVQEQ